MRFEYLIIKVSEIVLDCFVSIRIIYIWKLLFILCLFKC